MAESEIATSVYSEEAHGYLEYLIQHRRFTENAARKAIRSFFQQYFSGSEQVLEVGSGTGYFRTLTPKEFNGTWTQLDGQQTFLDEAREQHPLDTYAQEIAEDLPFPNASFDVVLGFNSYDLFNLSPAIEEAFRVLKSGGYFFSIHDTIPQIDEFIDQIRAQNLPSSQSTEDNTLWGTGHTKAFRYIPKENVEAYRAAAKLLLESSTLEDSLQASIDKEDALFDEFAVTIYPSKFYDHFQKTILQMLGEQFKETWTGVTRAVSVNRRNQTQKDLLLSRGVFVHTGAYELNVPSFGLSSILDVMHLPSAIELSTISYIAAKKL